MATKKVRCTLCDGSGFVTRIHKTETSCGIARATCPRCHGTGQKEVPMTNADRIRAMSDEELATTIHAIRLGWKGLWCDFHCENEGDDGCDKCIEDWLKQPAEEETT